MLTSTLSGKDCTDILSNDLFQLTCNNNEVIYLGFSLLKNIFSVTFFGSVANVFLGVSLGSYTIVSANNSKL